MCDNVGSQEVMSGPLPLVEEVVSGCNGMDNMVHGSSGFGSKDMIMRNGLEVSYVDVVRKKASVASTFCGGSDRGKQVVIVSVESTPGDDAAEFCEAGTCVESNKNLGASSFKLQ